MKSYKSYKFSDSEYNGTTITNMIEHYWSNISNQTYEMASFLNSSNAFSGTYYKHDNNNGFIIFSGQSPSYKTQKGIIMNGNWTWTSLVTNTDLQTAIATGNTVRQCVNATTDSQTKKFLIARPDDAPIYESSRALLTVTKYTTFTFLMLHSSLNEVFVAFLYESNNITPSIWKRMDNAVGNLATEGRLGLDFNSTTKILSLYLGSNRIGTINVN